MITVFTPTYNRAHLLPDLYSSLKEQTCKDFEWLIVDDGSTDDTEKMVNSWLSQADFSVRYIKKENGGKQRAVNLGVQQAKGEYFFVVDSDDVLTANAVETAVKWFDTIKDMDGFAGIAGQKGYKDGKAIGGSFSGSYLDATSLERPKYNITGDKAEIFYTEVLKNFPFPEFEGEKFVPEALVYNRIASAGYKLRWFNQVVYLAEYLPDGYSANVDKLLIKNWKGYSLYVKELMHSRASLRAKAVPLAGYMLRCLKKGFKI